MKRNNIYESEEAVSKGNSFEIPPLLILLFSIKKGGLIKMNQAKLRELIISYKIKVVGDLGQLSYLHKEVFRDISLRSILLCSDFVIKDDVTDFRTGKSLFIKGFIYNWIFNPEFDYEIIDEDKVPPQLEYFLEIHHKLKTIWIKPKY